MQENTITIVRHIYNLILITEHSGVFSVPPAPGLQELTGLAHCPPLRLRQEEVDEGGEEGQQDGEGEEGEFVELRDEDEGEDEADEQVGGPVDEDHHRAGGRPGKYFIKMIGNIS